MNTERRRHERILMASSTTLTFRKENFPSLITMVANISRSGIGLYADRPLKKGSRAALEIRFVSVDGNMRTELMEVTVVNVLLRGYLYFIGIEFKEEIKATNHPYLHVYLNETLSLN